MVASICCINPTMHQFYIQQCTIQNRNVQISVLNGVLWDMGQMYCAICELNQFQRSNPESCD